MADPGAPTSRRAPRFNHVAMSVPPELLTERARAEICDFYGSVFGWRELPTMTEDRRRLVLMAHRYDQFVFLVAGDEPMRCPRLDHWGQSVASLEELTALRDRAADRAVADERVRFVDVQVDEFPGLRLHAFYVGFLLPMMVETQFFEWLT